ncbi:MAG: hypothetical protein QOJ65_1082 [Fimbriimonadaceae bacterium]|jgi:hypothetical protein|nr:hypothetical protein [Fimbriimonadaceae bacterium]
MKVNFIIAGTQKGGTTALAQFLSSHPQVCMAPQKEVHFFDEDRKFLGPNGKPNYARYHEFFPNYAGQPAVGEATPIYMYLPFVGDRIKAYNGEMRLILILRDPAKRAYSHYRMELERGYERLSFRMALLLEPLRLLKKDLSSAKSPLRTHSYLDRGRYAKQLRNLETCFAREQMLILRNEDLNTQHEATMKRVYEFLGIDKIVPPPAEKVFAQTYPPMDRSDRAFAIKRLEPDIRDLESLLGWDLQEWRTG